MTAPLSPAPALTAEEAARVAVFDAAEELFRETTIDQLDRRHFGLYVSVPEREAVGYLYAVHDDFNDGYPSRLIVLVDDEGGAVELEFTDSDPASYPKTMRTACRVESFDAAEEPEEVTVERVARALADHTQMRGLTYIAVCSCGWEGDRFLRHLARAALAALRGDRAPLAGQHTTDEDSPK